MDARFLGLDNIMSSLGLGSAESFQAWYEEALEGRETEGLNIEGFEWAEPQLGFDYSFLEAEGRLKSMATYVDYNSEPLARGKEVELAKLEGQIPRQKRKINRGENDYRKELQALKDADIMARFRGDAPDMAIKDYLANSLFDNLSEIPDSHNASVTYQVGQMKSKRGVTLTEENNKGGIIGATFSANVPDENVTNEEWYTVDADGKVTYVEAADPIMSLKKKIRSIRRDRYRGYQNVAVEINYKTLDILMEHPAVLTKLGYSLRPELMISPSNDRNALKTGLDAYYSNQDGYMQNFFKNAIGADQLIVDTTIVGADRLNSATKKFEQDTLDVFDEGVILIRPAGIIGSIYNVVPLRPDGQAIVAGIFGNRGIIEYRYNRETRTQTWVSELTCLAVPNAPKKLHYFEVQGTTPEADDTPEAEE